MLFSRTFLFAGLILGLAGCGGDSLSPTTPTMLAPLVRSVVAEGGFTGLQPVTYYKVMFTTTQVGTLDVTVDWTLPEDAIWLFLGQGAISNRGPNVESGTYRVGLTR